MLSKEEKIQQEVLKRLHRHTRSDNHAYEASIKITTYILELLKEGNKCT